MCRCLRAPLTPCTVTLAHGLQSCVSTCRTSPSYARLTMLATDGPADDHRARRVLLCRPRRPLRRVRRQAPRERRPRQAGRHGTDGHERKRGAHRQPHTRGLPGHGACAGLWRFTAAADCSSAQQQTSSPLGHASPHIIVSSDSRLHPLRRSAAAWSCRSSTATRAWVPRSAACWRRACVRPRRRVRCTMRSTRATARCAACVPEKLPSVWK